MVFRSKRMLIRLILIAALVLSAAGTQYIFENREILPQENDREGFEITRLGNDPYSNCADGFTKYGLYEKEFVIKENEGLIAIYEATPGGLRLFKQTDFKIDGLEPKLRERIKIGIQVRTQEEVEHLLESWET